VSMIPPASKRRKLNEIPSKDGKSNDTQDDKQEDSEFLIGEYKSDDEAAAGSDDSDDDAIEKDKSKKTKKKLAVYLGGDLREDPDKVEEEEQTILRVRKIFYCSRTHSQLSQFAEEVKRSFWGKDIRMITLGSRKTLCINPKVSSLPTQNQINDKCLDMVQSGDKKPADVDPDSSTFQSRPPSITFPVSLFILKSSRVHRSVSI
jgi:chromosome transmission fidelity protein 1